MHECETKFMTSDDTLSTQLESSGLKFCLIILYGCSGWGKLIENLCSQHWRRWKKVLCIIFYLICCWLLHYANSLYHFQFLSSELMLLGFISLLLTATSSIIANICMPSKFYNSAFAPCTKSEIDEELENNGSKERKLFVASTNYSSHFLRRMLNGINRNSCKEVWTLYLKYLSFTIFSFYFSGVK